MGSNQTVYQLLGFTHSMSRGQTSECMYLFNVFMKNPLSISLHQKYH